MTLSPEQYQEIAVLLADRKWRLNHLYWIFWTKTQNPAASA